MTSPRDIERRLDDLEDEADPDPPDHVFLEDMKNGTCPPGTPTIGAMLSGAADTDLLVDTRDTSGQTNASGKGDDGDE